MLIVATARSNNLIALDGTTGQELWRAPLDGVVTTKPVIVADGILVGTSRGCIRRSLIDGTAIGAPITSNVVGNLLVDGQHVWFGTTDGKLHVVDVESWRPIASTPVGFNGGGATKVRDQIVVAGDQKYFTVRLNTEGDGIDVLAWCEDVSWLGKPVAPLSAADGRLWIPARGWGMMCLGAAP
jgi:outer membrane protein assembly factor BamB